MDMRDKCLALFGAAKDGDLETVCRVLDSGVVMDHENSSGMTPLICACHFGHHDIVLKLIGAGANVNKRDDLGCSPLIHAANGGYHEIVQSLIKARADVNAQSKRAPDFFSKDTTALQLAVRSKNVHIVKSLLVAGSDINTVNKDGHTPLEIAEQEESLEIIDAIKTHIAPQTLVAEEENQPPAKAEEKNQSPGTNKATAATRPWWKFW